MDNLLKNEDCLNYFLKYIINLNTYHVYIEILYILCHTCHDFRETILSNRNQFPKKNRFFKENRYLWAIKSSVTEMREAITMILAEW